MQVIFDTRSKINSFDYPICILEQKVTKACALGQIIKHPGNMPTIFSVAALHKSHKKSVAYVAIAPTTNTKKSQAKHITTLKRNNIFYIKENFTLDKVNSFALFTKYIYSATYNLQQTTISNFAAFSKKQIRHDIS